MNTAVLSKFPWRDYLTLCKAKVVALMMITAWVGMLLACAPNVFPFKTILCASIGIALCAGSAAAINHLVDRHIDEKMQRTQYRPLVVGKVTVYQAMRFSFVLAVLGLAILILYVNSLTAWLTLGSLIGYAFIYTMYLKKATPQNIVIGGITGALPPLLGQTAITGQVEALGLMLALIIFTWTPPHFWALALFRIKDYENAKLPMLPITHGVAFTKLSILLYTFLLVLVTFLLPVLHLAGTTYTVCMIGLNAGFLYYAYKVFTSSEAIIAWCLFQYSIVYLFALFIILLIEHYLIYFMRSLG
ncbi:heme o synthase [Candidatus Berkiella cookevillensis]|nr:heme o synthase [Candidatus Berkiella cookevillensis]